MNQQRRAETTYILPIKAASAEGAQELGAYLALLDVAQIIVVDASEPAVFDAHARVFPCTVQHIQPDPDVEGCNGKVRGVLTALRRSVHPRVVIGDDDVRYDRAALDSVLAALDRAEVARPQNYFSPVPWHALLDNARQLINRGLDGDWPGTLAFRRAFLPHGYNPDALFENLELVRTVRARGGREAVLYGTFVKRLPPTTAHFWTQRVRQAYDEFARPARLIGALSLLPLTCASLALGWWQIPLAALVAGELVALRGLLRARAYRYMSPLALAFVPLWLAERAVCSWAAIYERLRYGGVRYAGRIVRDSVCADEELRQRWAA